MVAFKEVSNLVEVLEHSVGAFGPKRLFGFERGGRYQWVTYKEFGQMVASARGALAALGVGRGDRVAIISDNSVAWATAAYATYGLGAHFVPMYEEQQTSEWVYILADSQAKVVLVAGDTIAQELGEMTGELGRLKHVINLSPSDPTAPSWQKLLQEAEPKAAVQPESDEVAGLIYTSGTTDQPKGVMLTHGNFAHNINAVRQLFDIRDDDCSLSFLPWAHSFGQTCELHCMLANGAAMGLCESVATVLTDMPRVRPTLLFAVPQIFNRIYSTLHQRAATSSDIQRRLFEEAIENARKRLQLSQRGQTSWLVEQKQRVFNRMVFSKIRERFGGRLRYAFSGGAALSREVAEFIDALGITVYEGYGLSETSPIATANSPGHRKLGSVGRPLPGVEIRIEPVEHTDAPGHGEVVIYGPNIMKGYHNLPEASAEAFTDDGGFRSGDLGRLDRDGYLYITGRIKEQYKLENGKYVVPGPLEELLKLSPYIEQVMICGANRPYNTALIVPDFQALADWALENGRDPASQSLVKDSEVKKLIRAQLNECGKTFRGYEHPRKFQLLTEPFTAENGMLTPKMSLKRRNIVAAYSAQIDNMYLIQA